MEELSEIVNKFPKLGNEDILSFSGEYRWLSNFWPCSIKVDGITYRSVEAAYVAAKTNDVNIKNIIANLPTSGACKKYGKTLPILEGWHENKANIMESLLRQKYAKGTLLNKFLILTNNVNIVEGNTWGDVYWGVCEGVGENILGKLIMKIRDEIKKDA